MAKMKDTDGARIPESNDGWPLFNLFLHKDGMMSMSAPAFTTTSGEYIARTGVLEVSLRDVFDEFLANKTHLINCPEESFHVAELLREYAERFHNMAILVAATPVLAPPSAEDFLNLKIAVWGIGDFQDRRSVNQEGEEDGN